MAQIGNDFGSREELEARIAEQLEIPHAILLPSARFGIWAGFRANIPAGGNVAIPVLNCSAVHEAAVRSGLNTKFVDCSSDSFLIDVESMPGASAWVLSELYGQTYDLPLPSPRRPFCILDMAMTVPEKSLLQRLAPSDLGLFSFGPGKAFFTGCGGVAVTRDNRLAQELKRMVELASTDHRSRRMTIPRTFRLAAWVMAHWEPVYGVARRVQSIQWHAPQTTGIRPIPGAWQQDRSQREEWYRMPVGPELRMVPTIFAVWRGTCPSAGNWKPITAVAFKACRVWYFLRGRKES